MRAKAAASFSDGQPVFGGIINRVSRVSTAADGRRRPDRSRLWTGAVLAVTAPFLIVLSLILWQTPYPLSEGVALLEDVASRPASELLLPKSAYYRPLFHLTLSSAWHAGGSLNTFLAATKLFHIVPAIALVVLFIWYVRPKAPADAAAAIVAVAVLFGSPGFLDNLEIPLTYTIVGMAALMLVWILSERTHRWWHPPAIVALTLLAIGFKEQGLVIVPVVLVAWWTGAPGVRLGSAAAVAVIAIVYVALRLAQDGQWATFEQDIGFGFTTLTVREAGARFGAFPIPIYAYNAASTAANVLFAEPTAGVFSITRDISQGDAAPWEILYLTSSIGLTGVIAWWGTGAVRRVAAEGWSPESRTLVAMLVALAASGALSFNYSRDRLGGMALVPYAVAAFFAVRRAITRAADAPPVRFASAVAALLLLAGAWQLRAIHTLEYERRRAVNSHNEWITDLHERRVDAADQPVYSRIMEDLVPQGTAPLTLWPTQYPLWVVRTLGPF